MPAKKNNSEFADKFDEIISAIRDHKDCHNCKHHCNKSGNAIYGLGILGATFYYLQNPPTGELFMTILKVILWPAFVAYRLLGQFGL